ncbi:MAG: flagellar motor switch protein FliG [Planctomycetota bacterium]|nr:flagellar motor switch protein FliG [Planctomycetota bacterium]
MDSIKKAAILILSLEKSLAAEVLSQLPRHEVEAVTLEIAQMDDISREQQDEAIQSFYAETAQLTAVERGGVEFLNELLTESLGPERAREIIDNLRQSMDSVPFSFLHKTSADNLLTFVLEEHPQTIALIMSHLPQQLAADLLGGLPANKQIDVIRRVAAMEQTSPDVIQDVEGSLKSRMMSMFTQQGEKTGGVPRVAEILNVADRMTNKGILETLDTDDSELAEEIRRLMFVFDDLMKLDDKSIQSLLKEVDNNQWAMALKGASEEIRDKVLGNLSQRAADMLREEMEFLGPVRVSDVEGMQQQIVDVVRRLEDSGEIVVASGDGDQFVS